MAAATKRPELLLSQLLTLHLDLALKRYRDPQMSSFEELAAFATDTLKVWDDEAGQLLADGLTLKKMGDEVLQAHREKQAAARSGLTKMKEALLQMQGSNMSGEVKTEKKEVAGSENSSSSFQAQTAGTGNTG